MVAGYWPKIVQTGALPSKQLEEIALYLLASLVKDFSGDRNAVAKNAEDSVEHRMHLPIVVRKIKSLYT
jgi:hypothetical protein